VTALYASIEEITIRIIELLKLPSCKAHATLLESLLSLILGVEEKFNKQALSTLPTIIDSMAS
jgi:hypothetical protein